MSATKPEAVWELGPSAATDGYLSRYLCVDIYIESDVGDEA